MLKGFILDDDGARAQGSVTAVAALPPTAAGPMVVGGGNAIISQTAGLRGVFQDPHCVQRFSETREHYRLQPATGLRITPPYCYLLRRA